MLLSPPPCLLSETLAAMALFELKAVIWKFKSILAPNLCTESLGYGQVHSHDAKGTLMIMPGYVRLKRNWETLMFRSQSFT